MEQIHSQTTKQRTEAQNRALHLWCEQVATALNEAGIPYKLLVESAEITNTMESTKSLFRLIAGAKFGLTSTTALSTKQLMEVWEDFNEILARRGVHIPFPSLDPQYSDNY